MTFKCENTEFDTYSAKSKQFYSLLIVNKAKYPNSFKTLSADLEFSNPLQEVFSIPYNVASETYVWSFQYTLLNNILFTNTKLFRIGLIESEKCSFCTIYKTYTISFMAAPIRAPFRTDSEIGGLIFGVKI